MTLRTIRTIGDPVLHTTTHDVPHASIGTKETNRLIADLTETMVEAQGVGIAAPQIGVNLRLAIINDHHGPFAIINPRIRRRSLRKITEEEGCLSIPGVFGMVRRSRTIVVTYLDLRGEQHTERLSGFIARVFQHEIDHLDGKLFVDRTKTITQGKVP